MARRARKPSESGAYHIVMRGLPEPPLFQGYADRVQLLRILGECKKAAGFSLYAYTLMDDHVHLLLNVGGATLESVMKRITIRYVTWYNKRYGRTGPVFYDRFLSEPVEDEVRLIAVLRHIHLNPVNARITKVLGAYSFDSYRHYESADPSDLVDTDYILSLRDRGPLLAFHRDTPCEGCLDVPVARKGITDAEALQIILQAAGSTDLTRLDLGKQAAAVKALRDRGVSIRAICRMTGLSFSAVRK